MPHLPVNRGEESTPRAGAPQGMDVHRRRSISGSEPAERRLWRLRTCRSWLEATALPYREQEKARGQEMIRGGWDVPGTHASGDDLRDSVAPTHGRQIFAGGRAFLLRIRSAGH